MKPPVFEYAAPATLEEAISLLQRHDGEAKIIAGGQSLMPLLNMRMARPELLIDLAKVPGLDYIREDGDALAIGAMTRQRDVELSALVAERQPLLHQGTKCIAHPQIRNRGTIGGSIAHADPAAVYPAVAVALDMRIEVQGPEGKRSIDAADFFVTYLTTALEPFELLTAVSVPAVPAGTGWSFQEIARRHGDFALAGTAVTMTLDGRGRCASTRVVVFGVGPVPVRASAAEALVDGQAPSKALFEEAGRKTAEAIDEPLSDIHASADYRRHLAGVLTRRGLSEAASRCEGAI